MKRITLFITLILYLLCISACSGNKNDYLLFKGLPKDEYPINTVNYKEFKPQIFCCEGNSVFFAWNGTVYIHDNEGTKPLFEKSAYCLNCKNGKLFFVENNDYDIYSRDEVGAPGLIYCYDIASETEKQITDFSVPQFVVTDEGIFYSDFQEYGSSAVTGICYFDESTGRSERLYDGINYIEYSEYRLKYDWTDDAKVFFFNDSEEYLLEGVLPYWGTVSGDYFYYRSGIDNSLNKMSLLNGNIVTLKPYKFELNGVLTENADKQFSCADYTVLNDEIYFIDNTGSLRRYNESTDDYTIIECGYQFIYLYSDNKNIYAVGWDAAIPTYPNPPIYHFIKLALNGDSAYGEILA